MKKAYSNKPRKGRWFNARLFGRRRLHPAGPFLCAGIDNYGMVLAIDTEDSLDELKNPTWVFNPRQFEFLSGKTVKE